MKSLAVYSQIRISFLSFIYNTAQRYRFSRLKHSEVITLEPGRLLLVFQYKSGLKFSSHDHARVEYLKLLKNDTIEQLQMGVSTIATALMHTAW